MSRLSPEAADVLDSLLRLGPSTAADLAADTGRLHGTVADLLRRMNARGGLVWRAGRRHGCGCCSEVVWVARASGLLPGEVGLSETRRAA